MYLSDAFFIAGLMSAAALAGVIITGIWLAALDASEEEETDD